METAKSIYRLRTDPDYKMSVKEIAQSLGKSEVWVSQYLSLMQLDQEIQKKLDPGVSKKERLPASVECTWPESYQ